MEKWVIYFFSGSYLYRYVKHKQNFRSSWEN